MQKFDFKDFLARYNDEVDNLELFQILDNLQILNDGIWLAGGAVRRTIKKQKLDSDFDFFFRDEESLKKFKEHMNFMGFESTSENEHNITYMGKFADKNIIIQAVTINFYSSIEDVLDSFDFTITQFGYDGKDLYCGDFSLWDLARNKLALHRLTYGVSTIRRLIKYTKQGYTACQGTFVDILNSITNNPSLIEADIKYID